MVWGYPLPTDSEKVFKLRHFLSKKEPFLRDTTSVREKLYHGYVVNFITKFLTVARAGRPPISFEVAMRPGPISAGRNRSARGAARRGAESEGVLTFAKRKSGAFAVRATRQAASYARHPSLVSSQSGGRKMRADPRGVGRGLGLVPRPARRKPRKPLADAKNGGAPPAKPSPTGPGEANVH